MFEIAYFNVEDRRREKQEARDCDQFLIVNGIVGPQQIAQRNGFFSALNPSHARIIHRSAPRRSGFAQLRA
jgi:hypothetical protein